jgi:hypothetical protein
MIIPSSRYRGRQQFIFLTLSRSSYRQDAALTPPAIAVVVPSWFHALLDG